MSRSFDYAPGNEIPQTHNLCSGPSTYVWVPADVRVCNGQLVEGQNDGGGVNSIDLYPKQPFDFAGRTGKVVFDVGNDSSGSHGAWPEFLITDEPVPGIHGCVSECAKGREGAPTAQNEIGLSFDNDQQGYCGSLSAAVGAAYAAVGGVYKEITLTKYDPCIANGSPSALNHIEVHISKTRLDVYGTQPGGTVLQHLVGADLTQAADGMPAAGLGFTRGLAWMVDAHYNARKSVESCCPYSEDGTTYDHSFVWDNFGFDGPKTYRDFGYDIPYANVTGGNAFQGDPTRREGYFLDTSKTFTLTGVNKGAATGAKIVLNTYTHPSGTVLTVVVNGHTYQHTLAFGYSPDTFSIPLTVADVNQGSNTITFSAGGEASTVIANASLIMVAAAAVP